MIDNWKNWDEIFKLVCLIAQQLKKLSINEVQQHK